MADESAKEFSAAVRAFEKASNELSQNTGKEIGKIVGKDLLKVTDPFVKSFNQIPGVQTLGNVGKTLFNKGFATLKDKREKKLLADRLGLTKKEFKLQEQAKKSNDAFKAMNEKMMTAANNLLGLDPSYLEKMNERDEQGRFRSTKEMVAAIDANRESLLAEARQNNILNEGRLNMAKKAQGNRAKQEEAEAEQAASEKKNRSLLESMVDGITTLNKSFLAGLKDKGKFALAGLAALIAAPVVALVSFFKQLAVEFKFLAKLTKVGAIGKIFAPLTNLFKGLTAAFKGTTFGALAIDKVKNVITSIKNFLAPVGKFFSTISGQGKKLVDGAKTASGILKFASGLGKVLGKIFLPITILMSAFDFVTGFMEGYKKDGIIGGLRDGVSKLFANLIGAPLNMLKDAAAWVLKQFGFNESSEAVKKFDFKKIITDIISWPFNQLMKIVDMVKNFDFKSLIPDTFITRKLGFVGDENKTPEQKAKEEAEAAAKAKAEAEKKARQRRINELSRDVSRGEMGIRSLRQDASTQNKGGFLSRKESDEEHKRDIAKYQTAQKELDARKAELAALRAAGGGTNVNASTTVNDARQSKTTNVTGAPIVDTTAAGAIASAN